MIGLLLLLCMCKAEKTHLDDRAEIRRLCVYRTVADILQTIEIKVCCVLKENQMY